MRIVFKAASATGLRKEGADKVADDKADDNISQLTWLVKKRSQIQTLLLALLEFANTHKVALSQDEAPPLDTAQQDVFALYVGAGFSLWKAVFLYGTDKDRTPSQIQLHAKELLGILVRDNAVGFPQEKVTRNWMGGYHLNNAWFRLDEALLILRERNLIADETIVTPFTNLRRAGREKAKFQALWEITFTALEVLFHLLKAGGRNRLCNKPPNSS
jgi:hypothetical protein